ncbi:MAG: hypothetical protein RML56_15085 [Burkholderiales bacterium]|nr:hypothetical protein [Burkholderiales bacterium]
MLRPLERSQQKYSLASIGDEEKRSAVLEFAYNFGVSRYELGTRSATSGSRRPMLRRTALRSPPATTR